VEGFVQFPLLNLNGLTKESAALHSDLSGGPIKKKKKFTILALKKFLFFDISKKKLCIKIYI